MPRTLSPKEQFSYPKELEEQYNPCFPKTLWRKYNAYETIEIINGRLQTICTATSDNTPDNERQLFIDQIEFEKLHEAEMQQESRQWAEIYGWAAQQKSQGSPVDGLTQRVESDIRRMPRDTVMSLPQNNLIQNNQVAPVVNHNNLPSVNVRQPGLFRRMMKRVMPRLLE